MTKIALLFNLSCLVPEDSSEERKLSMSSRKGLGIACFRPTQSDCTHGVLDTLDARRNTCGQPLFPRNKETGEPEIQYWWDTLPTSVGLREHIAYLLTVVCLCVRDMHLSVSLLVLWYKWVLKHDINAYRKSLRAGLCNRAWKARVSVFCVCGTFIYGEE